MFRLEIETESDAFAGDAGPEIAEILQKISARVRDGLDGTFSHPIVDGNGNNVGTWQYSE